MGGEAVVGWEVRKDFQRNIQEDKVSISYNYKIKKAFVSNKCVVAVL